jgi:hypothetical protein
MLPVPRLTGRDAVVLAECVRTAPCDSALLHSAEKSAQNNPVHTCLASWLASLVQE